MEQEMREWKKEQCYAGQDFSTCIDRATERSIYLRISVYVRLQGTVTRKLISMKMAIANKLTIFFNPSELYV